MKLLTAYLVSYCLASMLDVNVRNKWNPLEAWAGRSALKLHNSLVPLACDGWTCRLDGADCTHHSLATWLAHIKYYNTRAESGELSFFSLDDDMLINPLRPMTPDTPIAVRLITPGGQKKTRPTIDWLVGGGALLLLFSRARAHATNLLRARNKTHLPRDLQPPTSAAFAS